MIKFFFLGGILFLALLTESFSQKTFWRELRRPTISDSIDQRLFAVPYGNSKYPFRGAQEQRREVEESRPLCEEERKSQDIRDLIYESSSNFVQSGGDLDLRKYNLIPRKVDVIKCVSRSTEDESNAVCKPENCRERKVDIEVFGRLKNETGNVWEFVGTLSAVPVAWCRSFQDHPRLCFPNVKKSCRRTICKQQILKKCKSFHFGGKPTQILTFNGDFIFLGNCVTSVEFIL